MQATDIALGFADPVHAAQAVFRAVLDAMAHPGRIVPLDAAIEPPAPLGPAAACVLLALADFETAIWLDPSFVATPAVAEFLRFHTGAPMTSDPGRAAFALIGDASRMPPLAAFAQGTPEYPDRSTTLVVPVEDFAASGWTLRGPGIERDKRFSAAPLPAHFVSELVRNRARFPCGVDIVLASATHVAALPRSLTVVEEGT